MKAVNLILKWALLITTAIWGLFFNVLGAFAMITNEEAALHGVGFFFLAATVLGFLVPTVLVMLTYTKTAACLSVAGMASLFITASLFSSLGGDYNVFVENHMPSVFITILTITIAVLSNLDLYRRRQQRKLEREHAPAPSIFGPGRD